MALSSDAPYGPLDPWTAALDAYLTPPHDPGGAPRRVRPGTPADVVLLERPLAAALADPRAAAVRLVHVGVRCVHRA